MFEAVGEKYWPVFFGKVKDCLKAGGIAGLQIITINEEALPGLPQAARLHPALRLSRRHAADAGDPQIARRRARAFASCASGSFRRTMRARWPNGATASWASWEKHRAARLRRALQAAVGVLPALLRGRLPRRVHRRPAGDLQGLTRAQVHRPKRTPLSSYTGERSETRVSMPEQPAPSAPAPDFCTAGALPECSGMVPMVALRLRRRLPRDDEGAGLREGAHPLFSPSEGDPVLREAVRALAGRLDLDAFTSAMMVLRLRPGLEDDRRAVAAATNDQLASADGLMVPCSTM